MRNHHRPWFQGDPLDLSKIPPEFGREEGWMAPDARLNISASDYGHWRTGPSDPATDLHLGDGNAPARGPSMNCDPETHNGLREATAMRRAQAERLLATVRRLKAEGLNTLQIAQRVGKSPSWVSANRARL